MKILNDLSVIENGKYVGVQRGYTVEIAFKNGNFSAILNVDTGIRGISGVVVNVENGKGEIISYNDAEVKKIEESYRVKPDFFNQLHRKCFLV